MKHLQTDVVVIAAGPAGLAAAIAAAENDAKVIVFEKMPVSGGTANMGMGPFGVESRLQKASMDSLTKEKAFKMMMDYTHWQVDAGLVHDYFWKSGDTINWLEEMGVKFAYAIKFYPAGEATWHVVQPEGGGIPGPRAAATMIKIMQERALELGVEILLETPVVKICTENNKITGVVAKGKDGEEIQADAKAVIVATGGYGANNEMIRDLAGYEWGKDLFSMQTPGVVGDGLRMAWEAGAGKSHTEMERICGPEFSSDFSYSFAPAFQQPRTLIVNKLGERVMNEEVLQNTAEAANVAMLQSNRSFYVILSDKIVKYYRRHGVDWANGVFHVDPTAHFDEEMERAEKQYPLSAFSADTIEELAAKMGVDADALAETVDEYNEYCSQNYDDMFLKDHKYLMPIEGKKFYAVRYTIGAYGSLGGIKINSKLNILTENDEKILGFYGAGSDICDIYAGTYLYKLPGNTMGFALNSGRLAGERAADYAAEN